MVAHNLGEIYIDSRGSIYGCTASSTGPPFTSGTWQRIAAAAPNYNNADAGSLGQAGSINLLPSPIRVFDSRVSGNPADPGRAAGALTAGSVTTLQITGVSQIGSTVTVPAGAVGVIGNVTAAGPAASGYLRLYPAGRPQPGTTNLDYVKGTTVGNFCVVGLSASGQMNVYVEATTNVVFDITGFVF
jgi:hypothetical protein